MQAPHSDNAEELVGVDEKELLPVEDEEEEEGPVEEQVEEEEEEEDDDADAEEDDDEEDGPVHASPEELEQARLEVLRDAVPDDYYRVRGMMGWKGARRGKHNDNVIASWRFGDVRLWPRTHGFPK